MSVPSHLLSGCVFCLQVLETFAGRLIRVGVLARREVPRLTKYQIILARDQYRKNPSSQNMVKGFASFALWERGGNADPPEHTAFHHAL